MASKKPATKTVPLSLVGTKVLLIDDEYDITRSIRLALEREGMEVTEYNDAQRALYEFKPRYYQLVIVDIRMPGINGFEVYDQIRKVDTRVKICFLSAFELYDDEAGKQACKLQDTQCFIKKPVKISDLLEQVKKVLR